MQQFPQAQTQIKTALLVFLKIVGPPLVLYVDNPEELYKELKDIIKTANNVSPKLIEKKGNGPLKTICVLDTQIAGVALQEETIVTY
ncbi:MAG: hypothetical protein AB7V50_11175 [Vampirovibrionia bacterium]